MDEACEVWADVNFGKGFVTVRCTETGPHEHHRCEVDIELSESDTGDPPMKHNIFEVPQIDPSQV